MSIGIGAHANLVVQDSQSVIYEYGGYNLNDEQYRNADQIYDGSITIHKSCFLEPAIYEKIKKMPSGRKRLVRKRIPVDVDYPGYIKEGLIVVENCSNCWKTTEDEKHVDVMALHILFSLFREYQEKGAPPESIGYHL